ncbi:MAG TPA: hypothetical protein VM299_04950 [Solirubrobacteraceae bacterium]|nr:hypothetical protein [Solirubrobacteraceae bacterium]
MTAAILGASDPSAAPVVALIAAGVVIGVAGHLAGSRRTVVAGLAILFVASALLIVGAYVSFSGDGVDPRECDAPGGC